VENSFRALHDAHSIYSTSFMMKYVETLVYPDIPETILRGGEIVLTALYILAYAYWAKRTGVWRRLREKGSGRGR
jgi:hypothetical protein